MHPIMSTVRSALLGGGAAAMLCATAHAQEFTHLNDSVRGAPSPDNHYIGTPKGWKQPMTPWGEPDIQAKLDMMQAAGVPLERCASSYGGGLRRGGPPDPNEVHVWGRGPCKMDKQWLTQDEYDTRMEEYHNRVDRSNKLAAEGDLGGAIQAGLTDPNIPQRQTNLIVDPPNGLLPDLTPEGKRLALDTRSDWALPGQDLTFDGPQDFDSWDRCITRGMPSSMMPYRYNGGFFIKQAPGYVIFQLEMIHEARIIPTDGRPAPVSSNVRQWMGVSRGHWEGTTLVVETTNYHVGAPIINLAVVGSPPGNHFPYSEQMKTTERITRLNDDWWLYEITTEDPVVLTRPFTVRYPLRNDPSYLMPEYACHEGNTIIRNYTETSRYERAHPTPEPEQEPVKVDEGVADELAGEWVGTPRIVTIDDHIHLQFTKASANTVNGKLVGTNFGKIDKPLRNFKIDGKKINFTLPNIDPWRFAGELTDEGTIKGIVASAQGGLPVTFRRTSND